MIGRPRAFIGLAAGIGLMLLAPAAQAQAWQTLEAGRGVTAVAVQWDSGAALAVQCRREGLMATLLLAHPTPAPTDAASMLVRIRWDAHGVIRDERWTTADGVGLVSPTPERFARRLLAGGHLEMVAQPVAGPRQRYPLELPADPEALADVLADCDVPREGPGDAPGQLLTIPDIIEGVSPDATVEWTRRPSGMDVARYHPERAMEQELGGSAVISCAMRTDGRVRNCHVISEWPRGYSFGQATVRLMEDVARFGAAGGGDMPASAIDAQVEIRMTWMAPRRVQ
jgi:hypothetical protein